MTPTPTPDDRPPTGDAPPPSTPTTATQIGEALGVDQSTIARWIETNMQAHKGFHPDNRVKLPKGAQQVIAQRIDDGDSLRQVAADYGDGTDADHGTATLHRHRPTTTTTTNSGTPLTPTDADDRGDGGGVAPRRRDATTGEDLQLAPCTGTRPDRRGH